MAPTTTTAPPDSASVAINGPKVRSLRKLNGLTVTGLARATEVSIQYVSLIELGKRPTVSAPVFARICDALGVDDRRELLLEAAES